MVRAFYPASAALLSLMLIAAPVQAQEPSAGHLAAARELMDTTGVLNPVNELIPTFTDQIRKQNLTRPELSKDLEDVLKAIQPEMQLQRQQVTNVVSRTYAKWMTEAELKEVAAFFKTPAGVKYVQTQPVVLDDLVKEMHTWTQELAEYMMVRVRAEMSKRGHQLQ